MSMLGAQLEDLVQLSNHLTRTSGDLEACRTNSLATSTRVVETVRSAADLALTRISAEMTALSQSVDGSRNQAESTVWTGANSDRFRTGYAEFHRAMQHARSSTEETFGEFRAAIEQMVSSLTAYVDSFSASMDQASGSAAAMAQAVEQQRATLDQVMNTGVSLP